MSDDAIDEALDWQGKAIDCGVCDHRALLAEGRCAPLRACPHDRYARRIDRFFDWNPLLARHYLAHPYFEARACSAKAAEVFLLLPLLNDPEETVRWSAARRLPKRYLLRMRADPHREVRIRVAGRLEAADLVPMASDEDYYVRQVVARRLPPDLLIMLIQDPDVEVRRVVAQRIEQKHVTRMAGDPDGRVRVEAARRYPAELLPDLIGDADWRVRFEVARRADPERVTKLLGDEDDIVRDTLVARLAGDEAAGRDPYEDIRPGDQREGDR